jgi:AhpD family alkylhydroperoxidase
MSTIPSIMNESVKELVAIGAAMASNCEPCFRYHFDLARNLGVSREDMLEAVNVALAVKAAPHRRVVETAERYLAKEATSPAGSEPCACGTSGCC